MAKNEKYSHKRFTNQSFIDVDPEEFNNSEIVGSSFYQEDAPFSNIFPAGMTGVTFIRCNLGNVVIPIGASRSGGCNEHSKVQNDRETWVVDIDQKPVEPIHKRHFDILNLSTDPKDIPSTMMDKSAITDEVEKKEALEMGGKS